MGLLSGAAALALASGAAGITYTIQALAQAGDHIAAQKTIYGGSYHLLAHTLPQFGVTATFVDAHDLREVERAIQPNTKGSIWRPWATPTATSPTSSPTWSGALPRWSDGKNQARRGFCSAVRLIFMEMEARRGAVTPAYCG